MRAPCPHVNATTIGLHVSGYLETRMPQATGHANSVNSCWCCTLVVVAAKKKTEAQLNREINDALGASKSTGSAGDGVANIRRLAKELLAKAREIEGEVGKLNRRVSSEVETLESERGTIEDGDGPVDFYNDHDVTDPTPKGTKRIAEIVARLSVLEELAMPDGADLRGAVGDLVGDLHRTISAVGKVM